MVAAGLVTMFGGRGRGQDGGGGGGDDYPWREQFLPGPPYPQEDSE